MRTASLCLENLRPLEYFVLPLAGQEIHLIKKMRETALTHQGNLDLTLYNFDTPSQTLDEDSLLFPLGVVIKIYL